MARALRQSDQSRAEQPSLPPVEPAPQAVLECMSVPYGLPPASTPDIPPLSIGKPVAGLTVLPISSGKADAEAVTLLPLNSPNNQFQSPIFPLSGIRPRPRLGLVSVFTRRHDRDDRFIFITWSDVHMQRCSPRSLSPTASWNSEQLKNHPVRFDTTCRDVGQPQNVP